MKGIFLKLNFISLPGIQLQRFSSIQILRVPPFGKLEFRMSNFFILH